MTLARRKFLRFAAGAAALSGIEHAASAQNYPARPLRLILGYPAGGSTDLVSRIMGAWLTERLGQSVVIENRPGAGTNLAVQAVVASPPDGYTLLAATTNAINASFHATLPFDFLRDLAPVAGLVELPFARRCRPTPSPSSSRTRKPIPARSTQPRSAPARSAIWPGSCSSSWPASTWFTYRTTRIQRDARR
jgi:Tripartite tricarboxylate transporter family receptor